MRIKGFSMRPFLVNGRDVVELAPVDISRLRRGMVVLFRYDGRHILHRIRKIHGDKLIIKGDGNWRMTEVSKRSEVAAYVCSVERKGRRITFRSPRWRALSAWSLTLKLLRTCYFDLKKTVKKLIGWDKHRR